MTPLQYCQHKVLPKGSSLYYSLRVLAPTQREALTILHAWFRELNDIVWDCQTPEVAMRKFNWWYEEIIQTFAGNPHHPVCRALAPLIRRHQLLRADFQDPIVAFLEDFTVMRYSSFEPLKNYCQKTHGVLNQLCTHVLGYRHQDTLKYAQQLGIALHLTDLLVSLRQSLVQGRIYIPLDDLEQFQVSEHALLSCQDSETMRVLLAFQISRIRAHYHNAFKLLAAEERRNQRSGLIQAHLALATLKAIEQDNYQLLVHPVALTPWRKLWIAWGADWRIKLGL